MTQATAVVADTHAFIWYVDGDARLSETAQASLDDATAADKPIYVSAITLLEVHYLVEHHKVPPDTFDRLIEAIEAAQSAFELYPVDGPTILAAVRAPWPLGDPSDRVIAGTARTLDLPLVTKDRRIRDSGYVNVIW